MPIENPRIFYWCSDGGTPRGGEKHNYQHVDILNRNGIEAYALHHRPDTALKWFDNQTRVIYAADVVHEPSRDILVVPENIDARVAAWPCRRVVFNKNMYYGFSTGSVNDPLAVMSGAQDVAAIMSVSDHNSEYLRYAFPSKLIVTVIPYINVEVFGYRSLRQKRLQIAYAAKAPLDGRTLFHMLNFRAQQGLNTLTSARWVSIHGMTEREVAKALQESLILVFLSVHEGLGRLPLEAMACGCLICAFRHGPQLSFLPDEYTVANGDLLAIARRIESIARQFPDLDYLTPITIQGRLRAAGYSEREQERSVMMAWKAVLGHVTPPVAAITVR